LTEGPTQHAPEPGTQAILSSCMLMPGNHFDYASEKKLQLQSQTCCMCSHKNSFGVYCKQSTSGWREAWE